MLIIPHFPKAGGVSLRAALRDAYQDGLSLDYFDDPAAPDTAGHIDPTGHGSHRVRIAGETRCVYGHFHSRKYDVIQDAAWFTMLRHPVDNLISIYFFWKSAPISSALHKYVIDNGLSLLQTARLPILRWLMTRTYFGEVDMARFDLIGRHEARSTSIEMLSGLAGVEISPEVHLNRTPDQSERLEVQSDPKTLKSLENELKDDVLFYERYAFRDL